MVIYVVSASDRQKHVSFCNFQKTRKNTGFQAFWGPRGPVFDAILLYSKDGASFLVTLEWLWKADLDAMMRYSKDGAPLW